MQKIRTCNLHNISCLVKLLTILGLFFYGYSYAQTKNTLDNILKSKELKICQTADYAPYSYRNPDGSWDGLDVVIDNEFAKYLGVKVINLEIEWVGVIPALLSRKCDMLSIGIVDTPEREKVIAFGDTVYSNDVLLALRNDPILLKQAMQNGVPDYNKLKIAVAQGTSSEYWATLANIQYMTFKNFEAPVTAVLHRKADGFIFEDSFVKKLPTHIKNKLFIYDKPFKVEHISAAFRKEDKDLREKFNLFVVTFLKSGEMSALEKKYLK